MQIQDTTVHYVFFSFAGFRQTSTSCGPPLHCIPGSQLLQREILQRSHQEERKGAKTTPKDRVEHKNFFYYFVFKMTFYKTVFFFYIASCVNMFCLALKRDFNKKLVLSFNTLYLALPAVSRRHAVEFIAALVICVED